MNTFTQRFILVAQLTFVLFVLFLSGCSRSEARVSDGTRAAGAGGGTSGAERPAKTADGMTR